MFVAKCSGFFLYNHTFLFGFSSSAAVLDFSPPECTTEAAALNPTITFSIAAGCSRLLINVFCQPAFFMRNVKILFLNTDTLFIFGTINHLKQWLTHWWRLVNCTTWECISAINVTSPTGKPAIFTSIFVKSASYVSQYKFLSFQIHQRCSVSKGCCCIRTAQTKWFCQFWLIRQNWKCLVVPVLKDIFKPEHEHHRRKCWWIR